MCNYQFVDDSSRNDLRAFERELSDGIVDSINQIRSWHDLTIKQLADRLAHYGWAISVPTLSGILSGRKRGSFTAGELLVFARALDVSPIYLMLGLPSRVKLPENDALKGEERNAPTVLSWMNGDYSMPAFPGDDLDKESQSPAYVTEALTRQGLSDVLTIAHAERVIRWQAALLTAASEFKPSEVEIALPAGVANMDYLWDAINRLSGARQNQAALEGAYRIPFEPIEGWLSFIDINPPIEVEDPTIAILRTLTSEALVDRGRKWIRESIARSAEITERSAPDGARGMTDG